MTETLQALDDLVLVFREHTGETVGIQNHFVQGGMLAAGGRSVLQNLGGIHVIAQTETTTRFLRDGELVTSNHLDPDTESDGIVDGLLGIFTGRVEDGEETDELETIALSLVIITVEFFESNGQSTETTGGEFFNVSLKPVLDVFGLVASAKLDDDSGHTLCDALESTRRFLAVGTFSTFVDGVEGLELENLDPGMSLGGIGDGIDDTHVDGILVFGTGSIGGQLDDVIDGDGTVSPDGGAIDGKLVGGEGSGLV